MCKWKELYDKYRFEMMEALSKSQESKNNAANEVIKKYKQVVIYISI